jgi:hypothetical protein
MEPITELAGILQRIPDNYLQNSVSMIYTQLGASNLQIKRYLTKPERDIRNPNLIIGYTLIVEVHSQAAVERMKVHMYYSNKNEFPKYQYVPILINFIGHETAPAIAIAISEYLKNINI